jgi:hypothetical protein
MKLFSFQIPYSWYLIDYAYGNTCFWITHEQYNVTINIEPGNYTQSELVDALNTSFINAGFEFPPSSLPVVYNTNNGKITLNLLGGVYKQNDVVLFTINPSTMITFYDYTSKLQCKTNCVNSSFYLNQTLGWLMGYHISTGTIPVEVAGNTGDSVLDLNGPRYFILALDDYNMIGLKTLNGPWPKALYFNPNSDNGNVFVWPNPAQGEIHMFAQTLFRNYASINDDINLPQGYTMALRWCLAERLMPMYGKASQTQIAMIVAFAAQGKATLKRTNMKPMQSARFNDALLSSRQKDAGWILTVLG